MTQFVKEVSLIRVFFTAKETAVSQARGLLVNLLVLLGKARHTTFLTPGSATRFEQRVE